MRQVFKNLLTFLHEILLDNVWLFTISDQVRFFAPNYATILRSLASLQEEC
jgi:hypothetical protein